MQTSQKRWDFVGDCLAPKACSKFECASAHPPSMSTTLDRPLRRRTLRQRLLSWGRPCCLREFSPFLDFAPNFRCQTSTLFAPPQGVIIWPFTVLIIYAGSMRANFPMV